MFAHYIPPELAELVQAGMFVPLVGPNGRPNGRTPPYTLPLTHLPMMHMTARHSSSACPGEGPPQMRKMFIGGLSHETNDDALRVYFTQWGPVVDAIVIRDPTTKQSRGFGFVTFATIASLEAAMMDRPHIIAGKTVDSKRAIPREQMTPMFPPPFFACEQAPGCKLLLSGLNWDYHRVDTLRIYFEKFGSLDQVEILGDHRGFGFVVFEDKQSADKCLNENNGRHIIASKRVDVRPFPKRQSTYWRRNPDSPNGGTPNSAAPTVPHTLYDQLATISLNSRATQYDEDSSYGGTTTEDDCKSSEHGITDSVENVTRFISPSMNSLLQLVLHLQQFPVRWYFYISCKN
ncbi:hypothetical protein RB195_026298 [Necator americanus]|uniref:RRM domain-containing protein n=1 Tax=Necator americanus TaxID=51031 RepID=A0ABR1EWF5_NECAM